MLRNERGSSLLIVLMVMTVFTMIGLSLLGSAVSGAKQVSSTNGSIQSTNLAEMGVNYVELEVSQVIKNKPTAALSQTVTDIQTILKSDTAIVVDSNNPNANFTIKNLTVLGSKILDNSGAQTGEEVKVSFTSEGLSNGKKQKAIQTTIVLTRYGGNNQLYDPAKDLVKIFTDTQNVKLRMTYAEKFVHYKMNLELNPTSSLTYLNNLIVDGSTTLAANTNIIVKKNAHFKGKLDIKTNNTGNGNLGNVCVEGTLYYYGQPTDIDVETNFTSCSAVAKKNGIFAKKVVYRDPSAPTQLKWDIANIDIQTAY